MGFGDFLKSAIGDVGHGLDVAAGALGLEGPGEFKKSAPQQAFANNVLKPAAGPLETVGSGIRWLYSNAIAQPLSTAELVARKSEDSDHSLLGNMGTIFSAGEWAKAYHAAEHISPGQAFWHKRGQDNAAAVTELENSPLQYKTPDKAQLPPDWDKYSYAQQQEMLKSVGAPLENKAAADEQDNRFFHYASGATDFALNWFADPTIIGGKALGALKTAKITRPTGAFTKADIDGVMKSNLMTKTQQWLYANKDNPQLVNNLTMVRKSTMGPKFGAVLSTLKSEQEVNALLRVTMGDQSAIDFLKSTNKVAADHLLSTQARLSSLQLDHAAAASAGNVGLQRVIADQIKSAEEAVNADKSMIARYNNILDSAHELDQLNLTRWSFSRAADRTEAQNRYVAGPAARGLLDMGKTSGRTAGRAPNIQVTHAIARVGSGSGPAVGGAARMAQPLTTPVLPAIRTSRLYTDFWGKPVTVLRAFGNFSPAGHIEVQNLTQDSINELRGYLARIPNVRDSARADMLNRYIKAGSEWERKNLLISFEKLAVGKVSQLHGFKPEDGLSVYRRHLELQKGEVERMNQYTAARMQDALGKPIRADFFHTGDGVYTIRPNLVTRLVNNHVMMDLDQFDKILARNGSALKAIRPGVGSLADGLEKLGDAGMSMWKFGTLFRLGYIPRVLGDDLAGQVARLGAGAMAMRAGIGVKNLWTNMGFWHDVPMLEQRAATREAGAAWADGELKSIQQRAKLLDNFLNTERTQRQIQLDVAQRRLAGAQTRLANLPDDATAAKRAAHSQFVQQRAGALRAAQARASAAPSPGKTAALASLRDREQFLQDYIDLASRDAKAARDRLAQGYTRQGKGPLVVNGVTLPGALSGTAGEIYTKLLSPDQSLENIFGANRGMFHGLIQRSFDHGAVQANAVANPETHMSGWLHIINHQFAQDELGRRALAGASVEDMTNWLTKTAAGQAYWRRLGIVHDTPEYLANSVKADIDELVDSPAIRAKALTPEGVTSDDLAKEYPNPAYRPDVHVGQTYVGARETLATSQKIFRFWFDTVAGLPAARWSRHPLFNQLYEGHARAIVAKEAGQGVKHTVDDANRIAETARRLALHDTRKLVFDIAHKSDAVAALKLISPFFAATTEGWQRWARILADKPEVVGYAAKFFNTPLALGMVQDQNGNSVDQYGYTRDANGKRVAVSKSDRRIIVRLPSWVTSRWDPMGKFFGAIVGAGQDGRVNLSQDSMNLVFNGDPVFNPGTGPLVQLPVEQFVKDKPDLATMAQKAGVLPFGVDTSTSHGSGFLGRFTDSVLPRAFGQFLTSFDTTDDRYQAVKLQIMQQAAFEHDHFGKPMPTASQVAKRVHDYWLFSATSAFLGPIANKQNDPYQFYRDQYYKLRDANPKTADDQFLSKYGESYFVFAQAQSKNVAGIAATRQAVALSKKYADLLAGAPELGALITGSTGNGPFDPASYAYQLNAPLEPGGDEMQRQRMSATEAMTDNRRRLGWAKYTARMNDLTAQLISRGLTTFDDPGAEDLKAQKRGWTLLYSQPLYPDGSTNPYYNEAWANDFNTYDSAKYAKLIPKMTALVRSDLAKDPRRSDLQVLGQYLGARRSVMDALNQRKLAGGSATLTAQSNGDLLAQWKAVVAGLVESNTMFGDIYHRYLGRDMGVAEAEITGGAQ